MGDGISDLDTRGEGYASPHQRERLLCAQRSRLDLLDREWLEGVLRGLEEDVRMFGPAGDDESRMERIRARLKMQEDMGDG